MSDRPLLGVVVALAGLAAACGGGGGASTGADVPDIAPRGGVESAGPAETTTTAIPPPAAPVTRPDWLGTRVVTPGPDGAPPPTPPELDPRRIPTLDVLPPPADGLYHASVQPVPPDVAARSTWEPGCPVTLDELRYVTVGFWGFDDRPHTGEMLVHRDAAGPFTQVFQRLFDQRFPIEDMHVTSVAERDQALDTGDGNATSAFVCRPTRGSSGWSQHAYGLAVDINPFQNPYLHDGRPIPGLAASYGDRANPRPGMVIRGVGVVEAFADIGWHWGGSWSDPVDYMHFSATGR